MPSYLFQAVDGNGAIINDRIEADTLGQARYLLENSGLRDVRFFEDENADDIRQMTRVGSNVPPVASERWTPADEIACLRRKSPWAKLWWAFCHHLFAFVPLLLWNVTSLWHGRPYSFGDWCGFAATPIYFLYFLFLAAPSQVFHQILVACVWKDWRRLRFFTRIARLLRIILRQGIPERELRIREACALADQGRLNEALALTETMRAEPEHKEYLHLGRLSSVYEHAKCYDRQIECIRESQRVGSGGATELIDLAMVLVRRGRDPAGAKAALEQAKAKELTTNAAAWAEWCEGMIACEERDFGRAKASLERALKQSAGIGSPLMEGARAEMKTFLCLAYAGLGEHAEARRIWAECQDLMIARKETDLVGRCRSAIA